jgi:hypothetical protein
MIGPVQRNADARAVAVAMENGHERLRLVKAARSMRIIATMTSRPLGNRTQNPHSCPPARDSRTCKSIHESHGYVFENPERLQNRDDELRARCRLRAGNN